jgi:SAM-dependent methyltransferase
MKRKKALRIIPYIRSRLMIDRIIETIDMNQFRAFQRQYDDADPRPHGYSKYLDIRPWMADKLMQALYLGLHKSKPLKILDIGTGAGYFPYVCRNLGHEVIALDLDTVPMYNDICRFLKIDRRTWRIEKFEKLPDLGTRFDLVTAFMIKFNQHYSKEQWRAEEWKFLIEDLRTNHLTPNGRIFLGFNANLDGTFFDEGMLRYFQSLGARIWHDEVDIGGPKRGVFLGSSEQLAGMESSHPQSRSH